MSVVPGPWPNPDTTPGGGSIFPPGGGGPYDPNMEKRVTLLERGFEELRESVGRIEAAQAELLKDIRDFRRDVKEVDLPAIKSSLAKLEGQMDKTPTLNQLVVVMAIIFAAAGLSTGANLLFGKAPAQQSSLSTPR